MLRRLIELVLAGALAFLVVGVQPSDTSARVDPVIGRALDAITGAHFDPANPMASFPADYPSVMGYRPVTGVGPDGTPILMKSGGECSSFSGATKYRFDAVCKEHDLAYDVLRYSERVGRPLPAISRQQADDMFGRQLHNQCTYSDLTGSDFAFCHTMAESFYRTVEFNSWRQGFRPPALHESTLRWSLVMLSFGLFLGTRLLLTRWDRRSQRAFCDLRDPLTWVGPAAAVPPTRETISTGSFR